MIRVKLYGGLGNQMFQYAAAAALAERRDTGVMLDLSWFSNEGQRARTVRPYELMIFKLPARTYDSSSRFRKWQSRRQKVPVIRRGTSRFDPSVLSAPRNVYLDGYWQSEQYFLDATERIRADFTFPAPTDDRNEELLKKIEASPTAVSVHVRRGDYANDAKTNAFHGLMGVDYYRKACAVIKDAVGSPEFFVFSDDPAWCRGNLELDGATFVDWNTGRTAWEDMRLMSTCRHHVLANSSFSWWGAWLNPSEDKVVVAPRQWAVDPSFDTTDLVPDEWTRV